MSNDVWAEALQEAETPEARDRGLWAKCFAEADGDEQRTRAAYVRAKVAAAALAPSGEPAAGPDGPADYFCPNCGSSCPKSAERCNSCQAVFSGEGWRPQAERPAVVTPIKKKDQALRNEFGYCPNCSKSIRLDASSCFYCDSVFSESRRPLADKPVPAPAAQNAAQHQLIKTAKSRGVYIILGLFLGLLGIHNFYAGRFAYGVMQLLITAVLGWFVVGLFITAIWVIVELFVVTEDGAGDAFA